MMPDLIHTTLEASLDEATLQAFQSRLRGTLIRPGDDRFDAARRVWNGMIDKTPALIARCAGVADVIDAVRLARDHDLLVAVRGGGHSVAGHGVCEGGLVIDLSPMQGVQVDPRSRTAWAQPGLNWGGFDRETQAFGLAVTGGLVSDTGIAGLTLGGGLGWLMRKHGLTADNLLAADVVTADGAFLRASPDENADLFWGLQGGGGNFGIVSAFHYQLHPVGPVVLAGMVLHPMEKAPEVLRFYRSYAASAPDELTSVVVLRKLPALPSLPPFLHGLPVIGIAVCYAGIVEEGERVVQPLRSFGPPLVDGISLKPYTKHQTMFDAAQPPGRHHYWKTAYLPGLGDEVADLLVEAANGLSSPLSVLALYQLGGAVSLDEAAFALNITATWTDPNESDEHIQWTRDLWTATQPFATGGAYVNFLGDEGDDRVRAAYQTRYDRLVALKNEYDPTNFFRLNQNIKPTV